MGRFCCFSVMHSENGLIHGPCQRKKKNVEYTRDGDTNIAERLGMICQGLERGFKVLYTHGKGEPQHFLYKNIHVFISLKRGQSFYRCVKDRDRRRHGGKD